MGNEESVLNQVLGIKEKPVKQEETAKSTEKEQKEETKEVVDNLKDKEADKPEETAEQTEEQKPEETAGETSEEETKEEIKEQEPEEKTEEEVQPKVNEGLVALAKEINPEGEFVDEQSAIETIRQDLENKKEYIEKAEKFNGEMLDIFDQHPAIKEFMRAVIEGIDPQVAAGIYISETLAPEEGEKNHEQYKTKREEIKKLADDKKKLQTEFTQNATKSKQVAEVFLKENSIEQKWMEKALKEVSDEIASMNKGIVSKEFLTLIHKGKTFDERIKKADEQGYLRGKNEKIKLEKVKKAEGDGMPKLNAGNKPDKESKPKPRGLIDMALDSALQKRVR